MRGRGRVYSFLLTLPVSCPRPGVRKFNSEVTNLLNLDSICHIGRAKLYSSLSKLFETEYQINLQVKDYSSDN